MANGSPERGSELTLILVTIGILLLLVSIFILVFAQGALPWVVIGCTSFLGGLLTLVIAAICRLIDRL